MYYQIASHAPIAQGEILDNCPILDWKRVDSGWTATESTERVITLTQACDLANEKTTEVQVAIVHRAKKLVDAGLLKPKTIIDQVRNHRVYGWYFLPAGAGLEESIVDLRDIHTLPRQLLQELVNSGSRVCALASPYREHLAQHFAVTFSRIALPEPYATEQD